MYLQKITSLLCISLPLLSYSTYAVEETTHYFSESTHSHIENDSLDVYLGNETGIVSVFDKRSGIWYYQVTNEKAYDFENTKQSDNSITTDLNVDGNTFKIRWAFDGNDTIVCTIGGNPELPISDDAPLAYPYAFSMSTEDSYIALPDSGGFLFKADGSDLPPMRLKKPAYNLYTHYHSPMAMYGLTDLDNGLAVVFDTPADATYTLTEFNHPEVGAGYTPAITWRSQKGTLGYDRQVRFHFSDNDSFVSLAKYYRDRVIAQGGFKSLKEKLKERPAIDQLVGAPHTWMMSSKYTRSPELIDDFKRHGIDQMVIKTDTHANFPEYRESGGDVEVDQENHYAFLDRAEEHGYLVGKYMTYSSIRPFEKDDYWQVFHWNHLMLRDDNFLPYSGIIQKNEKRQTGWQNRGVRVCERFGYDELIPEHFAFYEEYFLRHKAYFFDVEGALHLHECYDPDHPMTRSDDIIWRQKRAEYFRSFNPEWVIGTESGHDYLLPHYDWIMGPPTNTTYTDYKALNKDKNSPYFLGEWNRNQDREPPILYKTSIADPLSRQYGLNPAMRIPLYELVHGDQVVTVRRWEYTNNKIEDAWKFKDLQNMLWGTAPAYSISYDIWQNQKDELVASINTVCPWIREIGYDEMLNFEFLTQDKMVQKSTFSSGKSIIVNFSETPVSVDGQTIDGYDYLTLDSKISKR